MFSEPYTSDIDGKSVAWQYCSPNQVLAPSLAKKKRATGSSALPFDSQRHSRRYKMTPIIFLISTVYSQAIILFNIHIIILLIQPKIALAVWTAVTHWWLMLNFNLPGHSDSFHKYYCWTRYCLSCIYAYIFFPIQVQNPTFFSIQLFLGGRRSTVQIFQEPFEPWCCLLSYKQVLPTLCHLQILLSIIIISL